MRIFSLFTVVVLAILAFNTAVFSQSSIFLDGTPEYVNIGDLDVAGDQLTVEALINYTGPSVNIVSKHTDPSNVNYLLRPGSFEITTTNGFAAFGGIAAAGVTLTMGETYHLAATYDGAFLRYYVNGCLTGEMAWTGTMILNNVDAAIGQQSTCECEQFAGHIGEVRIWNVARTQAEIGQNMLDLPTPAAQPGLLAYYKFQGNYLNVQGNATWDGVPVGALNFEQIPYAYPTILGVTATSSPVICESTSTGAIDIAGNGGYLPYEYSVDGATFFPTPAFDNLPPGDYTVYARSNVNCVATTTVTVLDNPELLANIDLDNVSCFGLNDGSATINPSGGNGPNYTFEWSNGNTDDLSINNLSPDDYSVLVADSCKHSGNELVVNGHFENGDTGFTSDYSYCANCFAATNSLPGGNYLVGYNAAMHHNNFQGIGNGGQGNFMIINGAETANTNVWCQTISVNPNTYYVFSSWVSSVHATSPAQLQFSVNGGALGPVFSAPATVNTWSQFFGTWYSGASTSATICIVNQNTNPTGNDFGLDDISFKECVSCEETVPFSITEPDELTMNLSTNDEVCNGANGEISVDVGGGTEPYQYSFNGGGFTASSSQGNLSEGSYSVLLQDVNGCELLEEDILIANQNFTIEADLESIPNSSCLQCNYDGPSIMINELMVSPLSGDGSLSGFGGVGEGRGEWIELYNPNWCDSIDISCYYLGNSAQGGSGTAAGGYVIPEGTIVPPLGFALVRGGNAAPVPPALLVQNGGNVVELVVPYEITDPGICVGPNATRLWFPNAGGWFAFYDSQGVPQDAVRWGTGNVADLAGAPCVAQLGACDYNGPLLSYNNIPAENKSHASMVDASSHLGQSIRRFPDGAAWAATGAPTYATCNDPSNCLAESGISFCNGQATVMVTSGTGPFTYLWNDPASQTNQTALNLCAGDYEVIVTDGNGCSETFSVTVDEDVFTIEAVGINPGCNQENGSIVVTVDSDGDYTYVWSENTGVTDSVTTSVNDLGADVYSVSVTGGGCVRDTTIVLIGPDPIVGLNLLITVTSCGLDNGAIAIGGVVGGTAEFLYNLNGQGFDSNTEFSNLPSGSYTVEVTDAAGCAYSQEDIQVAPSVGISGVSAEVTPATCGLSDGQIEFDILQGNPPYQYVLSGTSNTEGVFIGLASGNYALVITDSDNCTYQQPILIPIASSTEDIHVPNVITANNDNHNDNWFIIADCVEEFECAIFNRWGNLIYNYFDITGMWNGNDLSGKEVGEGVYFYRATLKFYSGNVEELHGHITVVR